MGKAEDRPLGFQPSESEKSLEVMSAHLGAAAVIYGGSGSLLGQGIVFGVNSFTPNPYVKPMVKGPLHLPPSRLNNSSSFSLLSQIRERVKCCIP